MIYKVGKRYETAFKSICALVQSGCIDNRIISKVSRDCTRIVVREGENHEEYEYDPSIIDTDISIQNGMGETGASWFESFRGAATDDNGTSFLELIEVVAKSYHDKYSLIEYNLVGTKELESETKEQELYNTRIKNFLSNIIPDIKNGTISSVDDDMLSEAYGVSLKVKVSTGTGASLPFLCKLFFSYKNKEFYPLDVEGAEYLDNYINRHVRETEYDKRKQEKPNNIGHVETEEVITNKVLGALSDLLNKDGTDLEKYIMCNSSIDEKLIYKIIEEGPSNHVEILFENIEVISIYHIFWKTQTFNYIIDGQPVFRFSYEINNQLTLWCLSCNSAPLIMNNVILMGENEDFVGIELNLNDENFGLTSEEIMQVKLSSLLREHNRKIICQLATRNTSCSRLTCQSQKKEFKKSKTETINKCINCPYPEIVYEGANGNLYLTETLSFARDRLDLVPDRLQSCSICGRFFTIDNLKDGICFLCQQFDDEGKKKEMKKTYKKYSSMFSTFFRFSKILSSKYAVESSDIIVFLIGNNYYTFDKCKFGNGRYYPKPHNMKNGDIDE